METYPKMNTERSAGIITYHLAEGKPKFLLLHYQSGHWGFPKGHIEAGETEEQTALRELAEETAIDRVFLINRFKGNINYYFTQNKQTIYKEVIFFLAESPTKEVALCEEHIGFRWLTYDMAIKALTFKNEQELLIKAENHIKNNRGKMVGEFSGHAAIGRDADIKSI
jgi:NTP pyrophosphohydrolases including oxidative damage repair enzymes